MTFSNLSDEDKVEIDVLIGQYLSKIKINEDKSMKEFLTKTERIYVMTHVKDCCEDVSIKDICGDLDDLLGVPILQDDKRSNEKSLNNDLDRGIEYREESLWTFYKFATIKGFVTIAWFGQSDYYTLAVDFFRISEIK